MLQTLVKQMHNEWSAGVIVLGTLYQWCTNALMAVLRSTWQYPIGDINEVVNSVYSIREVVINTVIHSGWCPMSLKQESHAVTRKTHNAAAVLFGLKFADNIHCKFKSRKASKAMLQSSKHSGAKQNLTQNGHSRSFKVMCFGVSGKAIRD